MTTALDAATKGMDAWIIRIDPTGEFRSGPLRRDELAAAALNAIDPRLAKLTVEAIRAAIDIAVEYAVDIEGPEWDHDLKRRPQPIINELLGLQ